MDDLGPVGHPAGAVGVHVGVNVLAKGGHRIAIEDLDVRDVAAGCRLAGPVMDGDRTVFRHRLDCAAEMHGTTLMVVDHLYSSSETRSFCGSARPGPALSERLFR